MMNLPLRIRIVKPMIALILLVTPGAVAHSADVTVVITHPTLPQVSGPARIVSPEKALSQSLSKSKVLNSQDLHIARRLGRSGTGLEANRAWFEWRDAFIASPSDTVHLRLDILDPVAGGKTLRSFWLVDAWPKSYRVIQRDTPALPPAGGGKFDSTVFEEVLVISFKYLSSTQP